MTVLGLLSPKIRRILEQGAKPVMNDDPGILKDGGPLLEGKKMDIGGVSYFGIDIIMSKECSDSENLSSIDPWTL